MLLTVIKVKLIFRRKELEYKFAHFSTKQELWQDFALITQAPSGGSTCLPLSHWKHATAG